MTKVLLYSGGLDSEAARLLWAPDQLLYIDTGTAYAPIERAHLRPETTVVDLPLRRFERDDSIIPMRNLLFVTIASNFGNEIALGATAGDRCLDKTTAFADLSGQLLSYLWRSQSWTKGRPIRVVLPIKGMTKRQLVEKTVAFGHDPAILARSFSCYHPTTMGDPCRRCKPCWRKWVAFAANGLGDLVPDCSPFVRASILPLIAAGIFDRENETLDVLAAFNYHDPENEAQAAMQLLHR